MKKFMDNDFLLQTDTAKELYHNYAVKMPIYDYHCHINVNEIYEDKTYENLTQVWLYGDHYKWRAMRLFGIDEAYITGDKNDYEMFFAYAKMMPYLIGNPIYHWTHLELQRYFGIDKQLSEKTAREIWDITTEKLGRGYSARQMILESKVTKICSTDDPTDSLEYHKKLREDKTFDVEVLPTFRPDKGVEICKPGFTAWIKRLGEVYGSTINSIDTLLSAFIQRLDHFEACGCVLADHGMDALVYCDSDINDARKVFSKALQNEKITDLEEAQYKSYIQRFFAGEYYRRGWTLQMHMGAMRSNNSKMLNLLGPDTGFDSINDKEVAVPLSRFLDSVNQTGLPKVVLYTLNPKDNYSLATMMGNFASGEYGSNVQFGCAWWFNDQKDGMEEQLRVFANLGVLSKFVGMLTDSRSFLSYTRHEYFRRILCNLIGNWVENGEYPADMDVLGEIVEKISYTNAIRFFTKE